MSDRSIRARLEQIILHHSTNAAADLILAEFDVTPKENQ